MTILSNLWINHIAVTLSNLQLALYGHLFSDKIPISHSIDFKEDNEHDTLSVVPSPGLKTRIESVVILVVDFFVETILEVFANFFPRITILFMPFGNNFFLF